MVQNYQTLCTQIGSSTTCTKINSDYDELKQLLKQGTGDFDEVNEGKFVQALESELEKVAGFCSIKSNELVRRVEHAEETVLSILKLENLNFERVLEEINTCTAEVTELSKFIRLNYSAFLKVLLLTDFEKAR